MRPFPWHAIAKTLVLALALAGCAEQPTGLRPDNADNRNIASPETVGGLDDLLTVVDRSTLALNGDQQARISSVEARPQALGVRVAKLNSNAAALLDASERIGIRISPTEHYVAVAGSVHRLGAGKVDWSGPLASGNGWLSLSLSEGAVYGTLEVGTKLYQFESIGQGLHTIAEIDRAKFPRELPPGSPAPETTDTDLRNDAFALSRVSSASTLSTSLGVLVAYTGAAAAAAGNISTLIQQAVAATNQAYSNSDLDISISLVHTAQPAYSESGKSWANHVALLVDPSDGQLDGLHLLRHDYNADLVILLVAGATDSACGIAEQVKATVQTAFAVVRQDCAVGNRSFAHEVGHLQGADHDPANDCTAIGYTCSPWSYGRGHVAPNYAFRTVMSYDVCGGCLRINHFSNPDITYSGQATGTTNRDNARVLDMTALGISQFGQQAFYADLFGPWMCTSSCQFNVANVVGVLPQDVTYEWWVYYFGTEESVSLPGSSSSKTITTNFQRQDFQVTVFLHAPNGNTSVTQHVCYTLGQC